MANMRCPLEAQVESTLDDLAIHYVRPDRIAETKRGAMLPLDFYIPQWGLYIEVKAWGTDRIHPQIERVSNGFVVIGPIATQKFCDMLRLLFPGVDRA